MSAVRPHLLPFATYTRTAMERHGYNQTTLAKAMGRRRSTVNNWLDARNLPTLPDAELLADTLKDKRILNLVVAARTGRCAAGGCGRTFHRRAQSRQRFCSARCRDRASLMNYRRDPRQDAIDEFCRSCEPEGLCRVADCSLRPWSPLLFVPLHELRSVS